MKQLKTLMTERRNPASEALDSMNALELVTLINREDTRVPRAIGKVLPQIALAVDRIARQLARGGRMIYVGSGTSGRIGALDSSECPPTFGIDPRMVQFVMAGGEGALARATEASEDSASLGRKDLLRKRITKDDVVIGLAASGRTPYTIAALDAARLKGATTIAIACNRNSALGKAAEITIEVEVGPEVLTGSSRLKAGSAQKMICNMLSTGAMVRLGHVYSNLMVNLHMSNKKLRVRGQIILENLTAATPEAALNALEKSGWNLPVALVMLKAEVSKTEAMRRLKKSGGILRAAIAGLSVAGAGQKCRG
ncbi:N-acetylmuramic acid 6-phosphate etherase [Telmatobacter bradus]|uniref:N-acetylmuramic acid 6-phosphate etherase n=1 Tax=Telmatobacter bradus TaxID=474953 RepID=UPI003B435E1C